MDVCLVNRRLLLKRYPQSELGPEHLEYEEMPIPHPADGEFLVRNDYISLDPAMRGWASPVRSYMAPVALGQVMRAIAGGTVIESCHTAYPVGTKVTGLFGLQDFALSDGSGVRRVREGADFPQMLGLLGVPGLTAYFGLFDVGRPQPGDVVLVSAAAGAVGSAVVQMAARAGCRVVGVAGGPAKCDYVLSLGAEHCIDYKAGAIRQQMATALPDGFDIFFDNVGGELLTEAMRRLRLHARVVICGAISQYNQESPAHLKHYLALLATRSTLSGFIVFDYADRYGEAEEKIGNWISAGKLSQRIDMVDGLLASPGAISKLFDGSNSGKLLVRNDRRS